MSTTNKKDRLRTELEAIRRHDPKGMLRPEVGVRWAAKHRDSVLYSELDWNDAKAGHKYRLWQMRQLIVWVEVREYKSSAPSRVHVQTAPNYVSLSDRRGDEGGYLPVNVVMEDKDMRHRHLLDVIKQLASIQGLYRFSELNDVRREIEKVQRLYPEEETNK